MRKRMGAAAVQWIGDYHGLRGPLVLSPDAVRAAIAKKLTEPDRKTFVRVGKKVKAALVARTVGGRPAYVLPHASHTRIHVVDARSVVLVRRGPRTYANPLTSELAELMAFDPGWTTERWTRIAQRLVVPRGGLVLFDARARDTATTTRGAESLRLPLPAGTYVVEHIARQEHGKRGTVSMLYVHPAAHRPALVAANAPPDFPEPLVIAKGVARAAAKLSFVETTGGPLLFLPARLARHWWGVCNESGDAVFGDEPTDYDRACDTRGSVACVKVKGETALVLGSSEPGAIHLMKTGALLLRWSGADHAAALLAPALGPGTFARTKLTLRSRGEPWVLMDSSLDGRTLATAGKREWTRARLPAGRYRVELMEAWHGEVLLDGERSDVTAAAVRLSR